MLRSVSIAFKKGTRLRWLLIGAREKPDDASTIMWAWRKAKADPRGQKLLQEGYRPYGISCNYPS